MFHLCKVLHICSPHSVTIHLSITHALSPSMLPNKQHKIVVIPSSLALGDRIKQFPPSNSKRLQLDRRIGFFAPTMFLVCQRLILGLKSKASEITTLVRAENNEKGSRGSPSETRHGCQQEHSLGTNKENT
jgi:hypothetical protein